MIMINEIIYRYIDAPTTVRAFTIVDENGDYNVYVNSSLSPEARERAIKHELKHIEQGDFDKDLPAHLIEKAM